ncbi:MAG: hypothetical protein ABIQ52_01775, partial [Vicinamibacterales bacterium]
MPQFLLLLAVSLAATRQAQPSLTDSLLKEVARVEHDLEQVAAADDRAAADMRLARAADAARKGRVYLSLHELSSVWRMQAASSFAARLQDSVKTADDFRREWKSFGEPRPPSAAASLPLVVAAICTSSEATAPATY